MATRQTYVVVGAGITAGKAVQELREAGFDGHLVLYGEEAHLPYERPPLSKGYLTGKDDFASAEVRPREWNRDHDVDLRLGRQVTTIDPIARTVTAGRSRQEYDKLLLATGSRPRHLPMADDSAAPISYLRTVEDSDRIKSHMQLGRRLVIVGGGWIGLEVAAAARSAGAHVTVLEALDLPLVGVLGHEVASIFASLHTSRGVDLRVEAKLASIQGDDGAVIVNLADGSSIEAGLLVVGIGAVPETSLARTAGLRTNNGIVVDQFLRTSELDIYAAGDVANAYHPLLDRHLRVEHWDNAIQQGVAAARNMMGHAEPYARLPYFYSDQYDLGMEYLGNVGPDGYDEVVLRGSPADETFTAFWLREDRVLAGMHANDWDAMDAIRKIVGASHVLDDLQNVSISLAQVAANLD